MYSDAPIFRNAVWIEGAALLQLQNNVRVPGNGSTVDYRSLIGAAPGASFRLVGNGEFDSDSGWRIVYAPLSISGSGTFSSAVSFNGSTFAAGVPTRGGYRFDSYRVSYWRRAKGNTTDKWQFGWTLKLRDAEVSLRQPGVSTRYRNTGFVPLIYFGGTRSLTPDLELVVDFDGLWAPQGSALDLGVFYAEGCRSGLACFLGSGFFTAGRITTGRTTWRRSDT